MGIAWWRAALLQQLLAVRSNTGMALNFRDKAAKTVD
jgi:hypothetical protein